MNKYYIYIHRKATDHSLFYIGKGCGQRAWNFNNRNNLWTNVKNKHGVLVEVIFKNLSESCALEIETRLILEFRSLGYSLANLSSGGESPVFSDEVRLKMSQSHKGKKQSEQAIRKTSQFHTGRKRSLETCERISRALKGKKRNPISVEKSRISRTGMLNVRSDKTVYHFEHQSGITFIGTRLELCEQHNINKKLIGKLFGRMPNKQTQGWSLTEGIKHDNAENP